MSEIPASDAANARALIGRAKDLSSLLAEEAAEAEALRRPTDRAIRELRAAGLFELMVPKCFGGFELDLDTFLEVGLALGEGDASMAWVTTFLIEHNWMFCQFPEAFQKQLFEGRSHVLAPGMVAPTGKAVVGSGGHVLDGRWQWATGVMHGEWVIAGGFSTGGRPDPDLRFFALPIEQARIEDTWHVDGMCGTGSNDVVVEGVFVPSEHSVSIADMSNGCAPGASLHAGPLYRTPMIPILTQAASMPLLGTAKACVRRFRERSQQRFMMYSQSLQAEDISTQQLIARSELEIAAAEGSMRRMVGEVMALRDAAPLEKRAEWGAGYALIVEQCLRTVQALSAASGASAHRLDNPLQRSLRDIAVGASHVVFDVNAQLRNYGRMRLGLEPSARLF